MMLPVEKSDYFLEDFDLAFGWYAVQAGEKVAMRYVQAVEFTLTLVSECPDIGVQCKFKHASLLGLRFFPIQRPFQKYLLFYRHDEVALRAERIMHGNRDLPRRLRESPGE
jgi:toxin ParE1/3/4